MNGFPEASVPWAGNKSNIREVLIKDGITGIGYNSFCSLDKLTNVTIPGSVKNIGGNDDILKKATIKASRKTVKKAPKGKDTFKVTSPAKGIYKKTTKTITVNVA